MNTQKNLPIFRIDTESQGSYQCGNKNELFYYTNAKKEEIASYISKLESVGYTLEQETYLNGNLFASLIAKEGLIHIKHSAHDNSAKILYDPLCENVYKPSEKDCERVTKTVLSVLPLDYSHREITDANGMAFVITLEDGRFIIIDGGYGEYVSGGEKKASQDAYLLYEYLRCENKSTDGKIKIAAWIITHPHEDHYGAFVKFSELYAKDVSVEYFIYNHGDPSTYSKQYPADQFLAEKMPKIIASCYKDSKVIKPHEGQILSFCDTEITVLHTHESCIPHFEPAPNDTSLVLRLTRNGKSVLFMADCDESVSALLVKNYGDFLKSDVLQINHHGYSGMTKELFDAVNPSYTIWTTSKKAFELRTNGQKYEFIGNAVEVNKYIYDKIKAARSIIADETIKQILFYDNSIKISIH